MNTVIATTLDSRCYVNCDWSINYRPTTKIKKKYYMKQIMTNLLKNSKLQNRKIYYFYIPLIAVIFVSSYYTNKYIYSIQQNIISKTNGTMKPLLIYLGLSYLLILLAFTKPNPDNEAMTPWIFAGSFMYVGVLFINLLTVISTNELLHTPYSSIINTLTLLLLISGAFCFTKVINLLIQYLIKIDFVGQLKKFLSNEKVLTAVVVAVITACFGLLGK